MGKQKSGLAAYSDALTQPNIALLIGNGVNRFDNPTSALSWQELVIKLAKVRKVKLPLGVVETLSFAEIGDILRSVDEKSNQLPKDLISLLGSALPRKTHIGLFAQTNEIPVLTTNFDIRLSVTNANKALPKRKLAAKAGKSKAIIPNGWQSYRGPKSAETFARNVPGLWHMHGSVDFESSIKLTSAQYATAFSKAFGLIKEGLYAKTYCHIRNCKGCTNCGWAGQSTWLDIFFHRDLVIVGFNFAQSETFLRPLVIERFKYLKHRYKNLEAIPTSYFVVGSEDHLDDGQRYFFDNFGIKVITLEHRVDAFEADTFAKIGDLEK